MDQHLCHAVGCYIRVPTNRLMCAAHWFMVPQEMRRLVWRTYRIGQEVDKQPSQAYRLAARNAINAVARQEGQQEIPEDAELIKTIEAMIAKEKDNPDGPVI